MKAMFRNGAILLTGSLAFAGAAFAQSFDQTMKDWFAAMSTVNVEAMDKLIAPDAKFNLASGGVQDKAKFLNFMRESQDALGKDPIRYKTLGVAGNEVKVAVCYNLASAGELMRIESYRLANGLITGASQAAAESESCAGF